MNSSWAKVVATWVLVPKVRGNRYLLLPDSIDWLESCYFFIAENNLVVPNESLNTFMNAGQSNVIPFPSHTRSAQLPSPNGPAATPNGKKVLIVDDSVLILRTLSTKLRSSGYTVFTAADGSEAVSTVRRERPDIILLDIIFPPDVAHGGGVAWDGFLIMNWLRRMDEAVNVPVIIITGGDPAIYSYRCKALGVAGFFHKPINHEELLATIDKMLTKPSAPAQSASQEKILFVDDENDWRFMATIYLKDSGYEVLTALNGTEALKQLEQTQFQLILLDLNLAGESGLDVMKVMKQKRPEVPVILYTGNDHDATAINAMLRQGAVQYLRKGTMGEMLKAVRSALAPAQVRTN